MMWRWLRVVLVAWGLMVMGRACVCAARAVETACAGQRACCRAHEGKGKCPSDKPVCVHCATAAVAKAAPAQGGVAAVPAAACGVMEVKPMEVRGWEAGTVRWGVEGGLRDGSTLLRQHCALTV